VNLIHGRMILALGFSTAAHVAAAWMINDGIAWTAAPAQRTLSVSIVPAAPRAVLNSIAPSATAALSPAVVQALEPSRVRVIDEPDRIVTARVADTVELLDAPLVKIRGPERTLRAREARSAKIITAIAADAEFQVAKAVQRDVSEKPLPPDLAPVPATSPTLRPDPSPRQAAAPAPAPEAMDGDPGSGAALRSPARVAGQPGADRSAHPASGNEPPQYPWTARLKGHQGRVVLSVWVGADGGAERLAVLRSSGYAALDRAAVDAVERWQFRPARRGGRETGSMLYVPVVFRLDD
jgi:protein TonB